SSACWLGLLSCGRGAPGCGGTSAKLGGMTSGAWRATANSLGPPPRRRLPPQLASSPATANAAAIGTILRIHILHRSWRFRLFADQERPDQQDQYAYRNRRVGDIEDQKRAPLAE